MPTDDPNWTKANRHKLFTRILEKAQADPSGYGKPFMESPEAARKAAQDEANRMAPELGVDKLTIPDKEVIYIIPERRAEHVHLFSLKPDPASHPRPMQPGEQVELRLHALCCYIEYVGAS